jgi:GPI-anchor transamidase subunit GAA1
MKMDSVNFARTFLHELEHERETHKTSMPYPWLQAKMKQIGLETYVHNFTLNYPFGGGKTFKGKNVYGIVRAPRIGSTESILLSMPYRPPNTAHTAITSTVPLLLAFAEFARKQKYWSKDLIFLICDQEQLGMQAFLEAYFGEDDSNILDSGKLYGRAGNIIAAINFEIQDFDVQFNNLKIEGLNGRLPNLDLHNLVVKLSHKQGIPTGYRMKISDHNPNDYVGNLENLLASMWTQSSGIPTGNHGLFHRYGIEALTIESVKKNTQVKNPNVQSQVLSLLRIVEGISRSLNNLLERFHQSFFFYVLISSERFISIGDYMPSIGLMAGSLLIKSFLLWLSNSNKRDENDEEKEDQIVIVRPSTFNYNVLTVGVIFFIAHFIGFLTVFITTNKYVQDYIHSLGILTETGIFYVVVLIFGISVLLPRFVSISYNDAHFANIAVLLELGTMLLAVSMLNFSLGFFLCVIIVPFALASNVNESPRPNLFKIIFKTFFHFILHPLLVIYGLVFTLSYMQFNEMDFNYVFDKSLKGLVDGITFAIVDSLVS